MAIRSIHLRRALSLAISFNIIAQAAPVITLYENPERAQLYKDYLQASYLHSVGKLTEAFPLYEKVISKDATYFAYDGYIRALADLNKPEKIANLYTKEQIKFLQCFGSNIELSLIFAQALLEKQETNAAIILFNDLNKKNPHNAQISYYTIVCYLKNNNIEQAQKLLEECLADDLLRTKHYLFLFLQSKAFLQQNNMQAATTAINKSLELFPRFDKGILFKAILMEQLGRTHEAIDGYKQFLDLAGRESSIEKQLVQLLFAEERFNEAAEYLKKNPSHEAEYYFDLSLTQLRAQQYTEALHNVEKAISMQEEFNKARLLKAEILLNLGRHTEVLNYLQSWVDQEPENDSAIRTLILVKNTSIGFNKTLQRLEALAAKHQTELIHAALGDLYAQTERYADSAACYNTILSKTTDQTIAAHIQFHICNLYFLNKDYKQLETISSKIIAQGQASGSLYNLLAYHYSEQPGLLKKALSLSNQALKTDPLNPAFLDTKGFILLKQGNLDAARKTLQTALQQDPGNPIITQRLSLIKPEQKQLVHSSRKIRRTPHSSPRTSKKMAKLKSGR